MHRLFGMPETQTRRQGKNKNCQRCCILNQLSWNGTQREKNAYTARNLVKIMLATVPPQPRAGPQFELFLANI